MTRTGPFPIPLPPAHIRRILDRGATCLILTRQVQNRRYIIEDASVNRRNTQHARLGRRDLSTDPEAFIIEILGILTLPLSMLGYNACRDAGYRSQREFFDEWYARHGWIDPDQTVNVCHFQIVEDTRYLGSTRDYTRNQHDSIDPEAPALDKADLERYAGAARQRHEQRQQRILLSTPLHERVRILEQRARDGEQEARRHLFMIGKHVQAAEKRRARKAA